MRLEGGLRRPATRLARILARLLRLRGEEGTELVEFALVVPGLMIVLTGTASFALGFYSLQQLGNAATTAVQLVSDDQGLVTDPCSTAQTSVQSSLPTWTKGNFSYSMTVIGTGGSTTYSSTSSGGSTSFTCTAAGTGGSSSTQMEANQPVVLTVTYNYTWLPVLKFSPTWSKLTSTQVAIPE